MEKKPIFKKKECPEGMLKPRIDQFFNCMLRPKAEKTVLVPQDYREQQSREKPPLICALIKRSNHHRFVKANPRRHLMRPLILLFLQNKRKDKHSRVFVRFSFFFLCSCLWNLSEYNAPDDVRFGHNSHSIQS